MEKWKFSSTAESQPRDILRGGTEKDFLKTKYRKGCVFGLDNLMKQGVYKLMGWVYDFRHILKKYVYRDYYGNLYEAYAPSRTALRSATYGKITILCETTR